MIDQLDGSRRRSRGRCTETEPEAAEILLSCVTVMSARHTKVPEIRNGPWADPESDGATTAPDFTSLTINVGCD